MRPWLGLPSGPAVRWLHPKAGHITARDLCAARQIISCQAGAIHTPADIPAATVDGVVRPILSIPEPRPVGRSLKGIE